MSRDRKNNITVRTNTGKMLFKAKFWKRKSQGHPRIFKVGYFNGRLNSVKTTNKKNQPPS